MKRLDRYLVDEGLAESREKAKHLIRAGKVLFNGSVTLKPSKIVRGEDISLVSGFEYVGRGGYKIETAVKQFNISFDTKVVADIGCSTGGFTHYALNHGARKVYAIDIGDTLHESLKYNERVVYLPNQDARTLKTLGEKVDMCLIDVTFSSIKEILTNIREWLKEDGEIIGLIKPPFEISTNGIKIKKVKDYESCRRIAQSVADWASFNRYNVHGLIDSDLRGKYAKQQEFFIYLRKTNFT